MKKNWEKPEMQTLDLTKTETTGVTSVFETVVSTTESCKRPPKHSGHHC